MGHTRLHVPPKTSLNQTHTLTRRRANVVFSSSEVGYVVRGTGLDAKARGFRRDALRLA